MSKNDHIKITEQGLSSYLLLCDHCGISSKIHLPIPVDDFRARIEKFYKDHKDCKKKPESEAEVGK